jgi:aminoglycoside phosphotransferase (APT) family kinase protein
VLSQPGHARERLGEQQAEKILAFMKQNKTYFPTITNDNIYLTHADFKPGNLLYTPQETISVLDWEFAHAGVGIFDFAILLRHRDQFPLDLDALKTGYEANGGFLPAEWIRSALITDFVNIVHLLNSPAERPQLFAQLEKTIATTMGQ